MLLLDRRVTVPVRDCVSRHPRRIKNCSAVPRGKKEEKKEKLSSFRFLFIRACVKLLVYLCIYLSWCRDGPSCSAVAVVPLSTLPMVVTSTCQEMSFIGLCLHNVLLRSSECLQFIRTQSEASSTAEMGGAISVLSRICRF